MTRIPPFAVSSEVQPHWSVLTLDRSLVHKGHDLARPPVCEFTTPQTLFQADTYNLTREHTVSRLWSCQKDMGRMLAQDFNQVKEFNFTPDQIPLLVDGFFTTGACFLRARATDLLYKVFTEQTRKIGDAAEPVAQVSIATLKMDTEIRVLVLQKHTPVLSFVLWGLRPVWRRSVRSALDHTAKTGYLENPVHGFRTARQSPE